MAEETKTILFYLLALSGLIIGSILFTGRVEPLPLEPLPPARPTEVAQEICSPISERNIFYILGPTSLEANCLLISGTVYASDFVTPLPGAELEVLLATQESQYNPSHPTYHAFRDWFQTDAAGQYKATIPKPGDDGLIHLYYRANSQDDCPLRLQLFFIDASVQGEDSFPWTKRVPHVPLPTSSLTLMKMAQVEPAGTRVEGPIDVVLPVPPPVSFRANLIPPNLTGEPLTISGVVYAADRKTPLSGARVEVWQANPTGFYEGYEYPPPAFNLQGRMRTDAAGRYEFTTLKPGPVKFGEIYLPAQIRFKVSYQDQEPFFTRIFFAGDPYLNNISSAPELPTQLSEQVGPTGPVWQGNFDVILPVSPSVP